MKRNVLLISSVVFLLSCLWQTRLNALTPTLTWDIGLSDGVKTYTYTLLNDAGLGPITELSIYMPLAGSNWITSLSCSDPSFLTYVYPGEARIDSSNGLDAGESMQIWLQTPADVPTVYDYNYWTWGNPGNWFWTNDYDNEPGGTSVPVPGPPVPEPSSLLALGCGLAGLGGLALRRRR